MCIQKLSLLPLYILCYFHFCALRAGLLLACHEYYILSQTFSVKWENATSTSFSVKNGTRQGGILSPVLFNVYIDELSILLSNVNAGCFINNVCYNHLIYADDTVLLAPSATALQQLLDTCCDFIAKNDLQLNAAKSKYMVFGSDITKGIQHPDVFIEGQAIRFYTNVKYLGVQISENLKDDLSIINCAKGNYARGNLLKRNFSNCSQQVKLRLFQSYCSNFYCCALWHNFSQETYRKLKVSYNNVFRIVSGCRDPQASISEVYVRHNVPHCNVIRRKSVFSLFKRVLSSSNNLVNTIVSSTFFLRSKLYHFWRFVLYTNLDF